MNELIGRVFSFETHVFPNESALYNQLASQGQSPKALMISCADSRIVPEHIMQAQPGDLFVAVHGGQEDGRTYVKDAIARGAVAVLSRGAQGQEGP